MVLQNDPATAFLILLMQAAAAELLRPSLVSLRFGWVRASHAHERPHEKRCIFPGVPLARHDRLWRRNLHRVEAIETCVGVPGAQELHGLVQAATRKETLVHYGGRGYHLQACLVLQRCVGGCFGLYQTHLV